MHTLLRAPTACSTRKATWSAEAPEVIAQEIVDDLEAASEQFRLIATDLASDSAT